MALKFHIHFFYLLLTASTLVSQHQVDQAEKIMHSQNFSEALLILDNYGNISGDSRALQLRGNCYFQLNQLDKAVLDYTAAKKLGNDSPELFLKMGHCKRHMKSYEEAIFFYKSFLTQVGNGHPESYSAYMEIKNSLFCATSKDSSSLLIQNFGALVNTESDELRVVQSPRFGNIYYLSANREDALYKLHSHFIDSLGQWHNGPSPIKEVHKNLYVHDISANGNSLVYSLNNSDKANEKIIISSYRDGEEHLIPLPEDKFQNATDIQLVNRNTIAFASEMSGGYGGYDIYTIKYENGTWHEPVNLGPSINSSHDDRSPFLSADMSSLYFSSRRPYSYGGYDVYFATDVTRNPKVSTLDPGINSSGDDLGFRICKDGLMAVFYSNRKTGFGGFDAYFAFLQMVPFELYRDSLDLNYVQDYFHKQIYRQQKDTVIVASNVLPQLSEDTIATNQMPELQEPVVSEPEIPFIASEPPTEAASYILYQDKQDLLNDVNKLKLDQWLMYLRENSDLGLKMLAYTDHKEPGLPEFVLYNTLKRATYLAEYLIDQGIAPERIHIESLAANYPVVKPFSSGKANKAYNKYNKRIDLELTNRAGQTLTSFLFDDIIPKYAYDRRHELFLSIREGLYYSVEIANTERLFKNAVLRLYSDIFVRKEMADQTNKYFIGLFSDLSKAKALHSELLQSSAPYAKLVAFYNGVPLNKTNVHLVLKEHPEISELGFQ